MIVKLTDKNPTDTADSSVETECSARSHALHHRQESRRHDDVRSPAGAGEPTERTAQVSLVSQTSSWILPFRYVPHGSHSADLHREEIGAHPRGVADGDSIEEDKPDDEDEDDDCWRRE
jgi:hypothetical protein